MKQISVHAIHDLKDVIGIKPACRLFDFNRSSYYYEPKPKELHLPRGGGNQPNALSDIEYQNALELLHSDRFVDATPYGLYTTLLDEGKYLASARTYYRILEREGENSPRVQQRLPIKREVPVLCAAQPNEIWSWDISALLTKVRRRFYYLYAVLDLYSRYVPGWAIEDTEDKDLAKELFEKTCNENKVAPHKVHADNGSQMRSETLEHFFTGRGIKTSFSRPRVSNDNPYSESLFKTAKYVATYPGSFDAIDEARSWFSEFFKIYNHQNYHSGINYLTPASVHFGTAKEIIAVRQAALDTAYAANPKRFRRGRPVVDLPSPAWINKPKTADLQEVDAQ